MWLCECDCGNRKEVPATYITRGRRVSCGCVYQKKSTVSKDKNLKTVLREYKSGGPRRGYKWELSDKQALQLLKGNCFYCGNPPNNTRDTCKEADKFTFNGIDRLDSEVGYNPDNCVSCCTKCNYAKGVMTVEEFENHITAIYNNTIKRRESKL
jgi:5-methylcytosine-specific restriction endonuclease McrA